jgi:hypothetical protein
MVGTPTESGLTVLCVAGKRRVRAREELGTKINPSTPCNTDFRVRTAVRKECPLCRPGYSEAGSSGDDGRPPDIVRLGRSIQLLCRRGSGQEPASASCGLVPILIDLRSEPHQHHFPLLAEPDTVFLRGRRNRAPSDAFAERGLFTWSAEPGIPALHKHRRCSR